MSPLQLADLAEAEMNDPLGCAEIRIFDLIAAVRLLHARVEELESSVSLAESDAMVRSQEGY